MSFEYFDSHTHVQFPAFKNDCDEVIRRALDNKVGLINVGTQKDTSRRAVEIAHEFENEPVYATVGLHPIHTDKSYYDEQELGIISENQRSNQRESAPRGFMSRAEEFDYDYYKKLASHSKVVAIGECGLDYYRIKNKELKIKQEAAFIKQIELAHEIKKPLMIHCREAYGDLINILDAKSLLLNSPPGVIHFFSGTKEEAGKFLEMGFYFTFGGVITFPPKADQPRADSVDYDEIINKIPLDRILSETDAPYVAPAPFRAKRNEPVYVIEIVKKLAEIKKVPLVNIQQSIIQNTKCVFGLNF